MNVDDNVVLHMSLTTKAGPVKILCHRQDGKIYCRVSTIPRDREIASFIVSEELQTSLPEILKLYVGGT